ncbi:XdhC family protein [Dysosmobacter sp.]|uniref:XdhC family protein n=1 Tax=Dysosmobacter sp. TaxID=2591382 RepID=UPI002A8C2260|nr:XdhC family protein [Dysosmobacter sp.]MDY3281680.1 XdhC family protein [Dysosmobacter sp.]
MRETMEWLAAELAEEQAAILVTVTETEGTTPRKAGAMMVVLEDGSADGTIGGGSVEYEALELCEELLRQGESAIRTFRYVQGDGDRADGTVTLHFQYLDGGMLWTIQQMAEWAADSKGVWLLRKFQGARVTETAVAALGDWDPEMLQERAVWKDGWLSVMVERPGRLYIFGGGHVASCLAEAAARAGFRVVVYQGWRPEEVWERFRFAEKILCGPFSEVYRQVTLTEHDFAVVLTSDPQTDYEVLKQILSENVQYIGCIGSKRKLSACRERLLADGFRQEQWDRVHAPIGLDIGAETPEELAVAITAELIAVRRDALRR